MLFTYCRLYCSLVMDEMEGKERSDRGRLG